MLFAHGPKASIVSYLSKCLEARSIRLVLIELTLVEGCGHSTTTIRGDVDETTIPVGVTLE